MPDQATELRKLVLRSARESASSAGLPPRTVVVTGGKGGVGTTTVAVNLSVALAEQGARVVLIDADLHRADVAMLCGRDERGSVADVMASRKDIHEVLVRGPAGIQIVPGLWAPGLAEANSLRQQERLLRQFPTLGRHAEIVVVDVGSGTQEAIRRFWQRAERIALVTTPDSYAVMDTYATIKSLAGELKTLPLGLVVNAAADAETASDVHRRLQQSCRRFLGFGLPLLGYIPQDPHVPDAARNSIPFVAGLPACPASLAVAQLAQRMLADNVAPPEGEPRAA